MAHWTFEPGELILPIHKILWAPTNAAHHNHLHVEGYPPVNATLASCTSKWTEAITTIRGALDGQFGEGDHYQVWDDTLGWTHMGIYNCRPIAGTSTPSQHAFSNAIDIGPYYGVEGQQKFFDFLTRKEEDMPLSESDIAEIAKAVWHRPITDVPNPDTNKPVGRMIFEIKYHAIQAHREAEDDPELAVEAIIDAIESITVDPGNSITADQIIDRLKQRL